MPAICRAAVAKSSDSVVPDTPHASDLLPVPGRSSECGPEQARSFGRIKSTADIHDTCFAAAFAFDFPASSVQTPQNATWVQAKRRRRGVGRAAWMPRERCQGMDARSARAHGASSPLPGTESVEASGTDLVGAAGGYDGGECGLSASRGVLTAATDIHPIPGPNAEKTEKKKTQSLSNAAVLRSNHCVR